MIQNGTATKHTGKSSCFFSGFFVFLILLFLTILIRSPDINMPLERDEGEYGYAAQEILRGAMPYKDTFCQKPPLIFLWYILGFKVFGQTVKGIHLIMVVASAISAFGLYILCSHLIEIEGKTSTNIAKASGWFATTSFTLSSAGGGYFGSAANTEIFMLVPIIFGVLFVLKALKRKQPFYWFLSGLSLGAAFITKQVALFSFICPGLLVAWTFFKRENFTWSFLKPIILGCAGIVVSFLPFVIWFTSRAMFRDFIDVAFIHNINYVGFPFNARKWDLFFDVFITRFLFTDGLLWACMVLCPLLALFVKRIRQNQFLWFPILWFISSLFGVLLGPYTFGHYFLQLLPPLVLATSALFYLILEQQIISPNRGRIIASLLVMVVLTPMVVSRIDTLRKPISKRSFDLYSVYGPSPFLAAREVGEYLRNTTEPGERILIIGSEPEILFYSGRKSATRYTIFYPLTGSFQNSEIMIEKLFDEIEVNHPMKIILVYCKTSFITGGKSTEKVKRIFSRIGLILKRNFVEEDFVFSNLDGKVLWKKRDQISISGLKPLFRIYSRKL